MVNHKLTVIICTCNRHELLSGAVLALERQDLPPESFDLIIVDNSTDGSAREFYQKCFSTNLSSRYIIETSPGLARARNCGVAAAAAPFVAFIDDDARPVRGWARALIQALSARSDVGIVGGPVRPIWPGPKPQWLAPELEGYLSILDRGRYGKDLETDEWLAGTNIAFRKEVLVQVGGFDLSLGRKGGALLSNEEIGACRAIEGLGFKALYLPDAIVDHLVHVERLNQSWMRRRVVWQTISDIIAREERSGQISDEKFQSTARNVLKFVGNRSLPCHGLPALFEDVQEPRLFLKQLEALASLTTLLATDCRSLLSLFDDVENVGS